MIEFFDKFKLEKAKLKDLAELILVRTIHIINQLIVSQGLSLRKCYEEDKEN